MPRTEEFCAHVADLLAPLGEISYRYMFGAYGFYTDGVLMALADEGILYLKADEENRPRFEALGMRCFRPDPESAATMPYHEVGPELLDDPERLLELAREALEAGRRARQRKRRTGKSGKPGKSRRKGSGSLPPENE